MRHISWLFVSVCSFTTYALSHNIGASVFSGALVRYRAYTSKGLSAAQVAVLVALCSFTFGLGTILLGGFVLVYDPGLLARLDNLLPAALTAAPSPCSACFSATRLVTPPSIPLAFLRMLRSAIGARSTASAVSRTAMS